MIAIINISDGDFAKDVSGRIVVGLQNYRLQINNKIILEFTHIRKEGLAVCLEKAARAVREQNLKEDRDMIEMLDKVVKR